MESILYFVVILFGIGLLIFVHELGHFLLARWNGVRVEIFSIGFGPALLKWRRKGDDTEYRIAPIPLGGFVKLAGELPTDQRVPEPDELWAKRPWQKMTIFVAGVAMNFLVAIPICTLVFIVGRYMQAPIVGQVMYPEATSGMRPGDRILQVDGIPIRTLEEYRMEVLRRPRGSRVPVLVQGPRDSAPRTLQVPVAGSLYHQVDGAGNEIARVLPGSEAEKAGLKEGDRILEAGGFLIVHPADLDKAFQANLGKVLPMRVRSGDEERILELPIPTTKVRRLPEDLHLLEMVVGARVRGWEGNTLEVNDRIVALDGVSVGSFQSTVEALSQKVGKLTRVTILRDGEEIALDWMVGAQGGEARGLLGIVPAGTPVIAEVPKDSFYYGKFEPGDELRLIPGVVSGSPSVRSLFDPAIAGQRVDVQVMRQGKIVVVPLEPPEVETYDVGRIGLGEGGRITAMRRSQVYLQTSLGEALWRGPQEAINLVELTVTILFKLVTLQESVLNLSGPIGIGKFAYHGLQTGPGNFLWLLAMISINLAVLNILPLPIFDGGHLWILLAYEQIRGKPPSEKFLSVFQYAGLAFLLVLIVFVTWVDLTRIL